MNKHRTIVLILAIILIEGFVTISIEMLTIRQLTPFFGSNVIVTSLIIGIFLLFLALGYWYGGRERGNYMDRLSRNISPAAIILGIGLSYPFISMIFDNLVNTIHIPYLSSLSLLLLFNLAPATFLLGQTVPLTTNLFNQERGVAGISGQALFLSTIGSFLGAIVTTLILFRYLGVAWTVVINFCMLTLLSVIISTAPKQRYHWPVVLIVFLPFVYYINIEFEKSAFVATNNYGNYQVAPFTDNSRHLQGKILRINNSPTSFQTTDNIGFEYIEFIKNIVFKQLKLGQKKILLIGAGGFSLTQGLKNANNITYVDIDKNIKSIVEKHFLNKKIKANFKGEDVRPFLRKNKQKFDVIVSDVYSNRYTIPPYLVTQEYFQILNDALSQKGIVILNIFIDPMFKDSFSRHIHSTVMSVFSHCAVMPLDFTRSYRNVIYLCQKNKIQLPIVIYRDDLNTSTIDSYQMIR